MNLFILSIYDGGYCISMYEKGFTIDLKTEENRNAFIKRFGVEPEYATIKDLKTRLLPFTKIIICDDGDIQVGDSYTWEDNLIK